MRKKIYLCLAAEITAIIIMTAILYALRELHDDSILLFGYIGAIAIINAYSTAHMRIIMMKADEEEDEEDEDDANNDDDESEAVDDNAAEDNTDDGILRGADGKL